MTENLENRKGSIAKAIVVLSTTIIALVMIAAAVVKIAHPAEFAENIFNYQAVPDAFVNPTAVFLPWLELTLGIALLVAPRFRLASAWMSLLLLIFFTVLVAVTVLRGIDISCGCFSVDPEAGKVGWKKVGENIGLICLATIAVVGLSRRPG